MTRFGYQTFDRASSRRLPRLADPDRPDRPAARQAAWCCWKKCGGNASSYRFRACSKCSCDKRVVRAELVSYRALTDGLSEAQVAALDSLLEARPDTSVSSLAWLLQAPQSPAARNMLALVERISFLRNLRIECARQRNIPSVAFGRIAASLALTTQHVRDLTIPRGDTRLCRGSDRN